MTDARSLLLVRVTAGVLCALGGAIMTWAFVRFVLVFPAASVLAAVLEIPLLVVGFLVLRLLRPVRDPPLLWSAAATIWGASAAIGCALLANRGLTALWAKAEGLRFAASWSDSLSAPLNEEVLKLCGVIMIVLAAPRVIKGPLDGMVFGALTGLGFQVAENVTYALNNIVVSGATAPVKAVMNSELLRLATAPGSHWTMTAVGGAGIGYLVLLGPTRRGFELAAACLAAAMAMHLLFDAPDIPLPVKVIVNFVVAGVLYAHLTESYLTRAHQAVADLTATGAVLPHEAPVLLRRRGRRRELRAAPTPAQRALRQARYGEVLTGIEEAPP
jgi:protease PrsW